MNDKFESKPDTDSRLPALIDKINAVRSPIDFNREYDEAVDELEDRLLGETLSALETIDLDRALDAIYQARDLRRRYLDLLEQSAEDPGHPLSSAIPRLRSYAIDMSNLRLYLQTVFEALLEMSQGRGANALRLLDQVGSTTPADEIDSVLVQQIKIVAENLTGLIRRGALDFAGARAAYDRACVQAQILLEKLSELQEDLGDDDPEASDGLRMMTSGAKYNLASNEARSREMQYTQQMASFDYAGAIDSAHASSEAFLIAADGIAEIFPSIGHAIRSSAFAALAQADIAEASMLLERREWDAASECVKKVRAHYETASRECLKSKLPTAAGMQETYLNTAFSWMTRFRRELERERAYAARINELQVELQNFYGSVRGALAPAGVTVNNATEMITSVKQQVEVTNRIEANIRSLLREIPRVLTDTDLPVSEKEKLSAEAIQLADDSGDRTTFFDRAGKFAKRLASAISTSAELAAPVVALLKALSVVS